MPPLSRCASQRKVVGSKSANTTLPLLWSISKAGPHVLQVVFSLQKRQLSFVAHVSIVWPLRGVQGSPVQRRSEENAPAASHDANVHGALCVDRIRSHRRHRKRDDR